MAGNKRDVCGVNCHWAMKTSRRHFLRNGLWVPAALCFPSILRGVPPLRNPGYLATVVKAPAGGGATTYTLQDNQYGTGGNDNAPAITNQYIYVATKFTAGAASYDVTKVTLSLEKVGTPSFTVTVSIYSDSAGRPSAKQGNGSKTSGSIDVSTFTTGYLDYDFLFTSGNEGHVNSGAAQWVAIICSSSPNDATNYIQWQGQALAADVSNKSPDGSTWTDANSFAQANFKLYSSP